MSETTFQKRDAILSRLADAFVDQEHNLRMDGRLNGSPDRWSRMVAMLRENPNVMPLEDADWLLFKSMRTVGDAETFKFALSRFLPLAICDGDTGISSGAYIILPKLEEAEFGRWPEVQRSAVLDALQLWAETLNLRAETDGLSVDPDAEDAIAWVNARRHLT